MRLMNRTSTPSRAVSFLLTGVSRPLALSLLFFATSALSAQQPAAAQPSGALDPLMLPAPAAGEMSGDNASLLVAGGAATVLLCPLAATLVLGPAPREPAAGETDEATST